MVDLPHKTKPNGRRRSILELAPLELDCMNALWSLEEASVRDIRERLAGFRPRAYTTIMTIMDRLAHKGVVTRRKAGRAYIYCPNLTAEQARSHAIAQVLEGFFGGSAEALRAHLNRGALLPESPSAGSPVGPGFSRAVTSRSAEAERALRGPVELPGLTKSAPQEEIPETPLPPRMDETLL